MQINAPFTLFHSPRSRSGRTKMLLDLLELPYNLQLIDTQAGEHQDPKYLELNPFGVVPTLLHGERVILESAAQAMYLGDLLPERNMAPPVGTPERATYYELFVLAPSVMEPTVVHAWRHPEEPGSSEVIQRAFSIYTSRFVGPYFLGESLTALDVFLHWSLRMFPPEQLTDLPQLAAYRERLSQELDWSQY